MKRITYFLVLTAFIISCQRSNKYVYIETKNDYDLFNKPRIKVEKPEIFEALNDSVAYCIAVDMFTRSYYASKRTEELLDKHSKQLPTGYPKSFKLITKDSIDISDGFHLNNPEKIIEMTEEKYKRLESKRQQ